MTHASLYRMAADLVLIAHVTYVAFVVIGLFLILLGGCCDWKWIRNPWWRALHLAAISLVAAEAWLGITCPLTTLEMNLRQSAGDATYGDSFIEHWLQKLLYYDAPTWVFTTGYTLFGLAVIVSWWKFRPRPFQKKLSGK
jgi:polyferredoxin